jgi:hypothetical protein
MTTLHLASNSSLTGIWQMCPDIRGYGPVDIEPFEDVVDEPHGLDAAGREPAAAPRRHPEPAFVLAEHPDRAAVLCRDDALQALTTCGLELSEGLRLFLCGWGAAL